MGPRRFNSTGAAVCAAWLLLGLCACGHGAASIGRDAVTDSGRPAQAGSRLQPRAVQPLPAQLAPGDPVAQQAQLFLPELDQLPAGGPARSAAQIDFELLPFEPLRKSAEGASWSPGSLVLNGALASGHSAWALYSLGGFSTDGSVVPDALTLFRNKPVWLALADFDAGRWRILDKASVGTIPLADGAKLVSPAGVFYVAVCADNINATIAALNVSANLDLPGGPSAVLGIPDPLYAGLSADFDAAASDGAGSTIIECLYDFGDGTATQTTGSAGETVSHTYADPGDYTINLQVSTDGCRIAGASFPVTVLADPTFPVAQLNLFSAKPTAEWPVSVSAAGSTGGNGAITSISYNWGDGSPDDSAALPDDVVTHVYDTPGSKTITLTITNDLLKNKQDSLQLNCAIPMRDLLVVYNSDIPESIDLAGYYASPETGRAIDPQYILGLPLGAAVGPEVSRVTYESAIRDPLKAFIDASEFKTSLKYILLFKGVPHRISGTESFSGSLNDTTCSAVDSELCTLYSDKPDADSSGYPNAGCLWNSSAFYNWDATGFYLGRRDPDTNYVFSFQNYQVCDDTGNTYPLDYLVGRITGYTYSDAEAMIDRGVSADTSAQGWVIFDSSPGRASLDTMVDPVYSNPAQPIDDSGYDLLLAAGYNVFADVTNATIDANDNSLLPPNFSNSVIATAGWGVNHGGDGWPSGSSYILNDLQWNYLPGCAWISYESFNGSDSEGVNRRGQGQILDFIQMGGSCAIGNVFEPYSLACGDERVAFYRYCAKGDRWIEAAYKSLRLLSWQEIVVGDPLCTVK